MDHTALDREAAIRSGQNPDETILMTFGQSKFGTLSDFRFGAMMS